MRDLATFKYETNEQEVIATLLAIDPKVKNADDFKIGEEFCRISVVRRPERIGFAWRTVTVYEIQHQNGPLMAYRSWEKAAQTEFWMRAQMRGRRGR